MHKRYRHKHVNDLAWVMVCPSLLRDAVSDEWCAAALARAKDALDALDVDPKPLLEHVARVCVNRRLGTYFEALVGFWLERLLGMRDVKAGIPIRENGITLGELDFLFEDPARGRVVHWEVAVKFYLCTKPGTTDASDSVGPGGVDRLANKISKIFGHQLRLGPAGAISEAFVKGMLFYPLSRSEDWRSDAGPREASAHHARGWWCKSSGRNTLRERFPDAQFAILRKPHWLSSAASSDEGLELLDFTSLEKTLSRHFTESQQAVLVAQLTADGHGGWLEKSRGFVVDESWPDELG